ncbi:MAG: LamG domain-containing protein [Gammaproteobacteria bacterium]|nr:LamG domain-containing protein [Gammaproteobacteria bacterium]
MADEEFMSGDLFATVRVQDLPASREVVAVERQDDGAWRVCGSAIANADGIAELGLKGSNTSRVYAFAIDHWGEPFTPNRTVAYGDIIRPSVFLGWLYRVTDPGVLPSEEPAWWNSTPGMPRPVGSAMAQAEMYFQPIAHGPVDIEWEVKEGGDPHWDNVVSLLHFDGDLTDETGRIWTPIGSPAFADTAPMLDGEYLTQGGVANSDIILGAEDFTIECFFRVRSTPPMFIFLWDGRGAVGSDGPYPIVYMQGSDMILRNHVNNGTTGPNSSVAVALNTSYHFAHVRKSGVSTFYLAGVNVGSAEDATNYNLQTLNVAYTQSGSFGDFLDMDEFRITKGVARYTENFTPPTEPFPNFK